ncbi:MAG TPA: hypothetical protein VE398_17960 [Acidobacteriota bacterium]|nr:hypothetical protein [Acidobacteriota bacterium]
MPAKKKSKPSFKVPEDLESAPQAGWVYRSESTQKVDKGSASRGGDSEAEPESHPSVPVPPAIHPRETRSGSNHHSSGTPASSKEESSHSSSTGIFDLTARTFSSGVATIGNALMLGAAILTAPLRIGLWMVGFRGRD